MPTLVGDEEQCRLFTANIVVVAIVVLQQCALAKLRFKSSLLEYNHAHFSRRLDHFSRQNKDPKMHSFTQSYSVNGGMAMS